MKKLLLACALISGSAFSANYTIDSYHADLRFNIDHFGTSTNSASIHGLTGQLQFDRQAKTGSIEIVVPLDKLTSGNADFDKHLKSADIFNVEKNKDFTFKSTAFEFDGDKVKAVKGDLTLNGKTNPVVLEATKFNCYDNPMLKKEVCGGDFVAKIDRTQWDINFLSDVVTKEVEIFVRVEAAKD